MKKLTFLLFLMASLAAWGQDWSRVDRQLADGSYKSAFAEAQRHYASRDSRTAVTAAWYMARAAEHFEEDARDSAVARYRALLPRVDSLHQALLYAFLESYDTALTFEPVLRRTPVADIARFCQSGKTLNVTPTAYDVLALMAVDSRSDWDRNRRLLRHLCDLHRADADDISIWYDMRLLEHLGNPADSLRRYIDLHRGSRSEALTRLYAAMAQQLGNAEDRVRAVAYCDTAVGLAPKSQGGVEAANLRADILRPRVAGTQTVDYAMPGRPSLLTLTYANTSRLHFRLVPHEDADATFLPYERLRKRKPVAEWTADVLLPGGYADSVAVVRVPPLEPGSYWLLAEPTAQAGQGQCWILLLNCSDLQTVAWGDDVVQLLDRRTGRPIVGQEAQVRYNSQPRCDTVLRSDSLGRVVVEPCLNAAGYIQGGTLVVERGGFTTRRFVHPYRSGGEALSTEHAEVTLDRPVYRAGDTVRAALLVYESNGREGRVLPGRRLTLVLHDPWRNAHPLPSALADDYGTAAVAFPLPADAEPGLWTLLWHDSVAGVGGSVWVRVEQYKQPKFLVTLEPSAATPAFGREYTLRGLAATYGGVPVAGARVHYRVVGRRQQFGWRFWLGERGDEEPFEATGEAETGPDGGFSVSFTPTYDSLRYAPGTPLVIVYTVEATVTDLTGESHTASERLRVGRRNRYIRLDGIEPAMSALDSIGARLCDLGGNRLDGAVSLRLERLQLPQRPLLPLRAPQGAYVAVDSATWQRDFPLMARDAACNDPSRWPVAERVDLLGGRRPARLASGVYRLTAVADGADTLVIHFTLTLPDARRVVDNGLLWSDISATEAEVGDTVRLRFGSRFGGVWASCCLNVAGDERWFRVIGVGSELQHIDIVVDSAMLGGFQVQLFALLEGQEVEASYAVSVPFSHRRLAVDIATFRDRLEPGEAEQWTLTVRRVQDGHPVAAALTLGMYDAALDSYGAAQGWTLAPWRVNASRLFVPEHLTTWGHHSWSADRSLAYTGSYPSVWRLIGALPSRFGGRRMYKMAASNAVAMSRSVAAEADVEEEIFSVVEDDAVLVENEMASDGEYEPDAGTVEDAQLRTDLSTLAFFAPRLRTAADGSATYAFRVPELLTQWHVRGLAYTPDLASGTLDRTLVTAKRLMVQPNMPRFLRQGDSLALLAKVMNQTDDAREVDVLLLLTDAQRGDTLCLLREAVSVAARSAAQVQFPVEVPQGVSAVRYKVLATSIGNQTLSDGEQGELPVLGTRMEVTRSVAFYLNGAGEKHIDLPLPSSATAEADLLLVEAVSNPVWLAVDALPHLDELENPSSIYLANQAYANLQRAAIRDRMGAADSTADFERPLRALAAQLGDDGGWSWMPEGESSLWVTEQILARLGPAVAGGLMPEGLFDSHPPLVFIDCEEQEHYEKYVKPHHSKRHPCEVTDVMYLYARSFYGRARTEAYKFYYANALKTYRQVENLYTQAQLALVFERGGNHREALDLLRRLMEKALQSDEMGIYWRDNRAGCFWYQRPIETQALIIQAFAEVGGEDWAAKRARMQQWLLKQKQTTHWGSDIATTEAVAALMAGGYAQGSNDTSARFAMTLAGRPVAAEARGREGRVAQAWTDDSLAALLASGKPVLDVSFTGRSIVWGGLFLRYDDEMDSIPASDMGVSLRRTYLRPAGCDTLRVGDKVTVRLDISCDRALSYVTLTDPRPAGTEPVVTASGRRWGCYVAVGDQQNRFYLDRLDRGHYSVEYELYVTNPGLFLAAPATIECTYAPEFRALAPAQRLRFE